MSIKSKLVISFIGCNAITFFLVVAFDIYTIDQQSLISELFVGSTTRTLFILSVSLFIASALFIFFMNRTLLPFTQLTSNLSKHRFTPLDFNVKESTKSCPEKSIQHIASYIDTLSTLYLDQIESAERLRKEAYSDSDTALNNRTFYMKKLASWIENGGNGGIGILKTHSSINLNKDKLWLLGQQLPIAAYLPGGTIARLNDSDFGFILPGLNIAETKDIGKSILLEISNLSEDPSGMSQLQASIGLVHSEHCQDVSKILSLTDTALHRATLNSVDHLELLNLESSDAAFGKNEWRELILTSISKNLINFKLIETHSLGGELLFSNIEAYLCNDNTSYDESYFRSVIELLNFGSTYDQHVLKSISSRILNQQLLTPISVHLTLSSMKCSAFFSWFELFLVRHKSINNKLLIELPEQAFIEHSEVAKKYTTILIKYGFKFGISSFGQTVESVSYIKDLKAYYAKVDNIHTSDLNNQHQNFTLVSLIRSATNSNALVIASKVEKQHQFESLTKFDISGFQGSCVNKTASELII